MRGEGKLFLETAFFSCERSEAMQALLCQAPDSRKRSKGCSILSVPDPVPHIYTQAEWRFRCLEL